MNIHFNIYIIRTRLNGKYGKYAVDGKCACGLNCMYKYKKGKLIHE